QGLSAERIADKWGFSRKQMDAFSLESHEKAITARKEGRFEKEIMPLDITLPDGTKTVMKDDEGPRENTSLEKLDGLQSPFKEDGKVTAGSVSQIRDDTVALLIMSRETAKPLGLKPTFRDLARTVYRS